MKIERSEARAPKESDSPILIVDHYQVGQRIALLQLNYLGFHARVVTSCRQAIRSIKQTPYSTILIGWGMPNCDGALCARYVRRLDARRGTHTSIIGVTAHARPGDKERCIASGMDDLLSKPITVPDMQDMLMRHLKTA